MVYDRDLRIVARLLPVLLVVNAAGAIASAFKHDWWSFVACLVWVINLCIWRQGNRNMQRTRDNVRLCNAAMMRVMAEDRHCDL